VVLEITKQRGGTRQNCHDLAFPNLLPNVHSVSIPSVLEFLQTSRIKYWIGCHILMYAFHSDVLITDQAGVAITL
jgi:hypothetical protein